MDNLQSFNNAAVDQEGNKSTLQTVLQLRRKQIVWKLIFQCPLERLILNTIAEIKRTRQSQSGVRCLIGWWNISYLCRIDSIHVHGRHIPYSSSLSFDHLFIFYYIAKGFVNDECSTVKNHKQVWTLQWVSEWLWHSISHQVWTTRWTSFQTKSIQMNESTGHTCTRTHTHPWTQIHILERFFTQTESHLSQPSEYPEW